MHVHCTEYTGILQYTIIHTVVLSKYKLILVLFQLVQQRLFHGDADCLSSRIAVPPKTLNHNIPYSMGADMVPK